MDHISTLISIIVFAFVTSITPGPNNIMLLSAGVNFGFRASVFHLLGVTSGVLVMLLLTGAGLQQVFEIYPMINHVMMWAGVAYMLYLAWKISQSQAPKASDHKKEMLSFRGAVLFQFVNPKTWVMVLGFFATCVPNHPNAVTIVLSSLLFGVVNIMCTSCWLKLGVLFQRYLEDPSNLKKFNYVMAGLLVASMGLVVFV